MKNKPDLEPLVVMPMLLLHQVAVPTRTNEAFLLSRRLSYSAAILDRLTWLFNGLNQRVIAVKRGNDKSPAGKIVPCFLRDCPMILEFINQISYTNPKGFGHPQKRVQADPLLSPFDFADVNWVQARLFGQFFLTHAGLVSVGPNGISQNFKLSRARHSLSSKQDRRKLKTPNMGVFLSCRFFGGRVEMNNNSEKTTSVIRREFRSL